MNNVYLTRDQFVDVLTDLLERVKMGDSYEGYVEYLMPEEGDDPDGFRVKAGYRIGNLQGQGGYRHVGTFESEPGPVDD